MADRTPTRCDQCGQVDDHPKAHLPDGTKHHDCLSVAEDRLARESAQDEGSGPKLSAIIDACRGGTKGDDLLVAITDGSLPQAEGLAYKAALADEEAS